MILIKMPFKQINLDFHQWILKVSRRFFNKGTNYFYINVPGLRDNPNFMPENIRDIIQDNNKLINFVDNFNYQHHYTLDYKKESDQIKVSSV